jgi:hypothetical protein
MTTNDRVSHDLENELHRASCAECRTLWDELENISAEAARLPLLAPSRDLWDGIEARIVTVPRALLFYRSQTFRLAIAATLLIAVSSGVTWQLATSDTPDAVVAASEESLTLPSDEQTGADDASQMHLASFSASVTQMEREIATLQTIVTERRSELDPRTLAVLEANLKLIDTAIAESRAALASDPASQFLSSQFTRAYTSKLTLLREAATLPAGI